MKFTVLCIGKAKNTPETALIGEYLKRLNPWQLTFIEGPHGSVEQEAVWFLKHLNPTAFKIALDEKGRQYGSVELARKINTWQTQGYSEFQLFIGGASGLAPSLGQNVHQVWSLGLLTWPHLMVRLMLAEQIYRLKSIIDQHPYHKQ